MHASRSVSLRSFDVLRHRSGLRRCFGACGLAGSVAFVAACGSNVLDDGFGGAGTGTGATSAPSSASGSPTSATGTATAGPSSGSGSGGNTSTGSGSGGASSVPDPNLDGPYTVATIDASITSAASNQPIPIHAVYPTAGPEAGPYPVIVVAHGFQLPASQYTSYVERLASFGYVALTADYPTGFLSVNNVDNAHDLLQALDWAASAPALAGIADADHAGMTGHSMGGKLSLLAATFDPRIKASITLDPVDGSMGCNATDCPDVSSLVPSLAIPTGFVGETTDATGGSFGACAPAADNFTTFYSAAVSPSLAVTVVGANHMSFLDDVSTCGFTCTFCNAATAPNADVNALSKAFVVAFYERYLKNDTAYDAYLTGTEANARYVATGKATIENK